MNVLPCPSHSTSDSPALTPGFVCQLPVVHELTGVSPPLPPRPQVSPDPEVPDPLFIVGRLELGSFTGAVKPKGPAEDSWLGPSPAWLSREEIAGS